MIPRATYRLQFHSRFTFQHAAELAPYFANLGVSHIYASPILQARRGSTHGYDVVDHRLVSFERGGEEGFLEMAAALRAHGLGIILDIVPNHMAVGDADNRWWLDVLEHGRKSAYGGHFDIDWDCEDLRLRNKVLAPFLQTPYADALASGTIRLVFDDGLQKLAFAHFTHRFPLRLEDYPVVLGPAKKAEDADLAPFNRPEALHALLQNQHFVLSWWRTARDRLNWRRFFDITDLAALNIDRGEVFDAVHAIPFELYERGLIDGLRVDHIDGLADPARYCRTLKDKLSQIGSLSARAARPPYLIVEKILADEESLPSEWDVDGTTGYDFMHQVSALQHAASGEDALNRLWRAVCQGANCEFETAETQARQEVLAEAFCGQARSCATAFLDAAAESPGAEDLSIALLQRALGHLIGRLRRYRIYANGERPVPLPEDLCRALREVKARAASDEVLATDVIGQMLDGSSGFDAVAVRNAATRFNQLSASVAAKAVEDTAFYRYGRLVSRNDVGSDPRIFSISKEAFHQRNLLRAAELPRAMLATATHDHKRGEDARARLAVLSEIPDGWKSVVAEWFGLVADKRPSAFDDASIYILFQTVVGAWPIGLAHTDAGSLRQLCDRLSLWLRKALRESKLHTSWSNIDEAYETRSEEFLRAILDPHRSTEFLHSLATFVDTIAAAGVANSLVQCTLRCTLPGVPDLYQGNEYWDFSFVDPDNRRTIDFDTGRAALKSQELDAPLAYDTDAWRSGHLKLGLLARLLHLRARQAELFASGSYLPLETRGPRAGNVLAYARCHAGRTNIVIAALHCAEAIMASKTLSPAPEWWSGTTICLDNFQGILARPLFQGREVTLPAALQVADCLSRLPADIYVLV